MPLDVQFFCHLPHLPYPLQTLYNNQRQTSLQHEHHSPLQSFGYVLTLDIPINTRFSIGMKNA
jgi:hypothetical protein